MSFKGVPGWGTDEAMDLKRRISIFLSQKGISSVRLLNIEVANGSVTFLRIPIRFRKLQSFLPRETTNCLPNNVENVLQHERTSIRG